MHYLNKTYLILLIVFATFSITFAQPIHTAIITDPQIGSEHGEAFLNSVSRDILRRNEIDRVIILGNLTANGFYDFIIINA